MTDQLPNGLIPRIVAGMFGFAFVGIGCGVLISMWAMPFHSFHSPPLILRIFASFIALPFLGMGSGFVYGAVTGTMLFRNQQLQKTLHRLNGKRTTPNMACPHCSAPIGNAEISPSGDVKCLHCQNWFNVAG